MEIFFEKKSGSRRQKIFTPSKQPKNKTVPKILLRGRYGSGKNELFSSELVSVTDETVNQLVNLHLVEVFNFDKPSASQFWKQKPLSEKAEAAFFRLSSGKAPGRSGSTFVMLKKFSSGKTTHLLQSLPPSVTYNFCRHFNKKRTEFLAF
ncbi:hypothetical protein P9112_013078 [Eukaryota sp. TZLM1-RC]